MNISLKTALSHALKLKCPNCGEAKLFKSYLKQVDVCAKCQTKWGEIRADDGPAWLTIMVVGHIVAPAGVWMAIATDWSMWVILPIILALSVVSAVITLPFAKAVFISIIWRTGAKADRQE